MNPTYPGSVSSTYTVRNGLAAGAVGSLAGQAVGLATGVQDKFSWGAVATGAIGAGLGASGTFAAGNTLPSQIGSAIASSLTTQGLNIITGQQKGFSWSSLAVAAVTAPVTSSISQSIKGSAFAQASPLSAGIAGAVAGVATSAVNELTRIAITGGKVNWGSVAIGGIQGGIYGYGEGLRAKARALNQPIYANNFNEDRQIRARMLAPNYDTTVQQPTINLRLSDDEVITNAMARQESQKGFNGLKVSWTDSPEKINARNGGANFSWGDALGNGVVYDDKQYMKGMSRTTETTDMKAQIEGVNVSNAASKVKKPLLLNQNSPINNETLLDLGLNLAPSVSETLSRGSTALSKAAGAQELLPARSLQQARIEKIIGANEIADAQAVIKGPNAKSAIAMAESAAKLGKFTKGIALVGDAATLYEESQRYNRAVGVDEKTGVVTAASLNMVTSKALVPVGAVGGAYLGAYIGTAILPGPGTIVDGAVGGIIGAVSSGIGYDEFAAPVVRAKIAGEKFRDDK